MDKNNWFLEWFDSEYYQILYNNRNQKEANNFIRNLVKTLNISPGSYILDAGCGEGRHAIALNNYAKHHYNVLGVDTSERSINLAKEKKGNNNNLKFILHDIRIFEQPNTFNCIFNLFTSFGYFNKLSDNIKILENFKSSLKSNGIIIIDYLNVHKTINNLVKQEYIIKQHICFHITRNYNNNKIIKEIKVKNKKVGIEIVSAFSLKDFKKMFSLLGLEIVRTFGDYDLNSYNVCESDRLIMIIKKTMS